MLKLFPALVAALLAGWLVAGSATSASAHHLGRPHCAPCGPLPPTVRVRTVHPSSTTTRYHDRVVVRHVPRLHEIVTVTRVQPIVHIHEVTRVHHQTVYYVKNTYAHETVHVRPITFVHPSVVNIWERGCGCH